MFCTNCGNKNNEHNMFCTSCGAPLTPLKKTKEEIKAEKKTNVFAIVGLIVTILISGVIGLILSIIGLFESKKVHSGKALSIVGIIVAIFKIIATFVIIALFITAATTGTYDKVKEKVFEEFDKANQTKDVKYLEMDEVRYNGVTIEFPAEDKDVIKIGLTWDQEFAENTVTPGKTSPAGRLGKYPGGASVAVTNDYETTKKVRECKITSAVFYNPKDGSETVYFIGGINYKSTVDDVKTRMKELGYTSVIENNTEAGTSLKYYEDEETDEYIIFSFVEGIMSDVTIQTNA